VKSAKSPKHVQGPTESGVRPRTLPPQTPEVVEANERLIMALLEAHQAQEELARRECELREMGDFRERLLAIVSHDLRNPLHAMMIGATFLANSKNLDPSEREIVRSIMSSGNRMRAIIAQLLDFTRARLGGGFQIVPTRLHLTSVVARVADELRVVTARTIIVHASGDLEGEWDPERLGAAFSNVLGNAAEHAFEGTPIEIALAGGDGDKVTCRVTNEGTAIPPDVIQSLFEPFRQVDPLAHRDHGNVGLGLYIAREIIAAHGGTIRASSSGRRTTFTFELPRKARAT